MSADEFDPFIERAFSRAPVMPDADAFAARVEHRVAGRGRVRGVVLGIAGLIGGGLAVGQLTSNLSISSSAVEAQAVTRAPAVATMDIESALGAVASQAGMADLLDATGGTMQTFWLVCALFVALAVIGATRLFQEI